MKSPVALGILAVVGLAGALGGACTSPAAGADACRAVESARCQRVDECTDFDAKHPVHRDGTDVDSCVRFYHEACLHGLASGNDPGEVAVNACVVAIQSGACLTVVHPETNSACAWLTPVPDAGSAKVDAGGGLVGAGGGGIDAGTAPDAGVAPADAATD